MVLSGDLSMEFEARSLDEIRLQKFFNKHNLYPVTDKKIILKFTIPDFYFPEHKLCVYLDGTPHERKKVLERDEEITRLLEEQGYKVIRYQYTPPLTAEQMNEILEIVKRVLEE
ncbi:MAG: DUF559 domain-containing protein [Thermoproteota archaeon]